MRYFKVLAEVGPDRWFYKRVKASAPKQAAIVVIKRALKFMKKDFYPEWVKCLGQKKSPWGKRRRYTHMNILVYVK